jgi:anti-sigma factor ChrR (cupin superfamily)
MPEIPWAAGSAYSPRNLDPTGVHRSICQHCGSEFAREEARQITYD